MINDSSSDDSSSTAEIDHAARILEAGGLVAFPTETVYGLGADAENPEAVNRIYAAKGRPANHPLIVHLGIDADPGYWSSNVSAAANKLIAAFWPGPLTLILPLAAHIPKVVTGGQDSIGLRCPAHPVAQALLQAFKAGKGGIAAPSANRFGRVSPTTARHVRDEFCDAPAVTYILEGGQSAIGIESTILDLTRSQPVLLRPGVISRNQLAEVLGVMLDSPPESNGLGENAPRVSGSLASHYAPDTPVFLIPTAQLRQALDSFASQAKRVALMHQSELSALSIEDHLFVVNIKMPADASAYAHDLYAGLRYLDAAGASVIVVEMLPTTENWRAVSDRLSRSAHGQSYLPSF